MVPDQWPGNPFDDGTLMHTVTERSRRATTCTSARRRARAAAVSALTVFLQKQADFVVP